MVLGLASVAGEFGRAHWLLDLASHFRLHYAVALVAAVVGLTWLRGGVLVLLLCLGCLGVQLFALWPTPCVLTTWTGPAPPPIRALLANVYTGNRDHGAVLRLLEAEAPDIVVLQEVDTRWIDALASRRAEYPYRLEEVRDDNFGIAVWSRHPWSEARIERFDASRVPAVVARVTAPAGTFQLIAVHTLPPAGGHRTRLRDEGLAAVARVAARPSAPVVVLGDLNCTPWSPRFQDLLRDGRLRDSGAHEVLRPTWPAALGVFGIPLDHCLVGPGVRLHARRIGPRVGSDHRPLIVEFGLAPGC